MHRKNTLRNSLLMIIVTILLLSALIPSTVIASSPVINEEDGSWVDNFEDEKGINDGRSKNYTVAYGDCAIATDEEPIVYDFSDSGVYDWGYERVMLFSGVQLLRERINPEGILEKNLQNEFNQAALGKIAKKDGVYAKTDNHFLGVEHNLTRGNAIVHHFRFKIEQSRIQIKNIEINWEGGIQGDASNQLYLWNYSYTQVGVLYGKWDAIGGTGENSLNGGVEAIENYVDEDGFIHVMILSSLDDSGLIKDEFSLLTDYVSVNVIAEVFREDAEIVSSAIKPDSANISSWEKMIWEDIELAGTDIKYQVFYTPPAGTKPIIIPKTALPGNDEGFDQSPVDLSSLNVSDYSNLSLKATFTTNDSSVTPRLRKWGITWQKEKDKWEDTFSSDLRVSRLDGGTIKDGNASIGSLETDWPFFGNDLSNNRVSLGNAPSLASDNIMWITGSLDGGLSSSCVVDGTVYVGSGSDEEGKMHTFNAVSTGHGNETSVSEKLGGFKSAPAVTDSMVIAGTSNTADVLNLMNPLNLMKNKLYAFDKSDISNQYWAFDFGGARSLCFSGSPIVHNGSVFVSSWSGLVTLNEASQILSDFDFNASQNASQIVNLLGGLAGNLAERYSPHSNRLFALNEFTGKQIWSVELPGPSLCTPAVDGGMVFVGCENINGSSLFAIDENNGDIIWENAEVGMIMRTAPLVYQEKVFVVSVEKVGSLQWITNIAAVSKNDGTTLWKIQIGDVVTTSGLPSSGLLGHMEVGSTSPIAYNGQVFVVSTNGIVYALNSTTGEAIWTFDTGEKVFSSPAFADGVLYVPTYEGKIFAIYATGDKAGKGKETYAAENGFIASPTIVDGVLYIGDTNGKMHAVGTHSPKHNMEGKIISYAITPPDRGKWWDKFSAKVELNGGDVEYSILDENYEVLQADIHNMEDISSLKSNKIHLCATLSRDSISQDPVLVRWSVSFDDEPDKPGGWTGWLPDGWTNETTPDVGVEVTDNTSGLDKNSARYAIKYSLTAEGDTTATELSTGIAALYALDLAGEENLFSKVDQFTLPALGITKYDLYTPWMSASCECTEDLKSGFVYAENTPITADELRDILPLDTFEDYIGEYDSDYGIAIGGIVFNISDLSGNFNTSEAYSIQVDAVSPQSDLTLQKTWYNEVPVTLSAVGTDDKSGVENVWLFYQFSEDNQSWSVNQTKLYDNFTEQVTGLWQLSFNPPEGEGYYRIYTEAVDNAGNHEQKPETNITQVMIDTTAPQKPDYPTRNWYNETPPTIIVGLQDNMMIKDVYYKIGSTGTYNLIEENIKEMRTNLSISLEDTWDTITAGNETHLYLKITDYADNSYETPSDKEAFRIGKDVVEPYSEVQKIQTKWHYSSPFKVEAYAGDQASPVHKVGLYYRFSSDNTTWTNWSQYSIDSDATDGWSWSFDSPKGSGYYQFYSQAIDSAGNAEGIPVEATTEDAATGVNLIPILIVTAMSILGVAIILLYVFYRVKIKEKAERED